MRLLLAEDDTLLGDGIRTGLSQEGYTVDWVQDGLAADIALKTETYELMVLDLGLPKMTGIDVLKKLRVRKDDLPVLILTARDTVDDRVEGLDAGADDYLIKPFDLDELTARLRALIRRHGGRASSEIIHQNIVLDPASHAVSLDGQPVELSPREFALLHMLLEKKGKVLSRARLEESMYSWENDIGSNAIEVHIHHLRKKLGQKLIRTIRGVGYIID
ncbi:MAG: response regulator [Gammaproteobacteria bacterium]|nr:response regulator [Gammaproteobacteria bacterium]